jgi:peroxiredoxin
MVSIDRVLVTIVATALASGCGPAWSDGHARDPRGAESSRASATTNGGRFAQGGLGAPTSADCSAQHGPDAPADPDSVETIQPEQRVPAFDVTTLDCRNFRSGDFVGKRPFVLVFFSSWCKVCERKMPIVRAAATKMEEVDFIGVALDTDETWDDVAEFVERHRLSFPIVRGAHYKTFSLGYDPFGSIPVIVVVGRDGVVVDLQVGYSPFDYNRLVGAAALAEQQAPRARQMEPQP